MGNVEAAVVRNVDKRTSRREHRAHFEAAVQRWRTRPSAPPAQRGEDALGRHVQVCVRKRPIFPHELREGEFDVITCLPGRVVVHDARMHPDLVNMHMNHHDFIFDETFGEATGNDEVYAATAHDLVVEAAARGGCGTVMMYGQTGSGKTYTMKSIYERAASALFEQADTRTVTLCFVELLGDACFDMLKQGEPVQLTTALDGSVHPYPCVEVPVADASELLALIELATRLRATAATGVHDQSSRSHAICRIFVEASSGDVGGSADVVEGCLTLVDLAGSEHRVDSAEHNAERRKEGAKINASLAALKECIRASAAGASFISFRQNRLTQMLRGCFAGRKHKTVIIACVSPSSKDTEHSLNTIRHACIMDGQGDGKSKQGAYVTGGVVSKELLGAIDVTGIARERRKNKGEPERLDDWKKPPPTHQAKTSNTVSRAALDRRCVRQLPTTVQKALTDAREDLSAMRQRWRLNRPPPPEQADGLLNDPEGDPAGDPRQSPPASKKVAIRDATRRQGPAAYGTGGSDDEDGSVGDPRQCPAASKKLAGRSAARQQGSAARSAGGSDDDVEAGDGGCSLASKPRAGRQRAVATADECAQDEDPELLFAAIGDSASKAMELFRLFCNGGKAAHEWRKNDLRLINTCVLPLLHGPGVQIDWAHPSIALEQLETIVSQVPPPAHLRGPVRVASAPSSCEQADEDRATVDERDAAPPRASTSGDYRRRLDPAPGAVKPRPPLPPRGRRNSNPTLVPAAHDHLGHPEQPSAPSQPSSARHSQRRSADGGSGAAAARSASPSSPSGAAQLQPVTHHDAIRARRMALEEQRRQSLQKHLEKNKGGEQDPADEIAALESQLVSRSVSAASKAGIKKRIAAIKAAQLREARAAEKRNKQQFALLPGPAEQEQANQQTHAAPPSPPSQGHAPHPSHGSGRSPCHASGSSPRIAAPGGLGHAGTPRSPRHAVAGALSPQHANGLVDMQHEQSEGVSHRQSPPRVGAQPRSLRGSGAGAASAPWGNEFSNAPFNVATE